MKIAIVLAAVLAAGCSKAPPPVATAVSPKRDTYFDAWDQPVTKTQPLAKTTPTPPKESSKPAPKTVYLDPQSLQVGQEGEMPDDTAWYRRSNKALGVNYTQLSSVPGRVVIIVPTRRIINVPDPDLVVSTRYRLPGKWLVDSEYGGTFYLSRVSE